MEEILNALEEIRKEIYKLGYTDNKENENYSKVLGHVNILELIHNDISEHNIHQQKKIKFLIDWLKEEREVK